MNTQLTRDEKHARVRGRTRRASVKMLQKAACASINARKNSPLSRWVMLALTNNVSSHL